MKLNVKKGDLVMMRTGKDHGKRGRVLEVRPRDFAVVVEGLNLVKKHQRPKKAGQKGELISRPRAVPLANVMVVCPSCGEAARLGAVRSANNERLRKCKRCGHEFA